MPREETYFDQQIGGKHVVVLKSYDKAFAREAFELMTPEALNYLGNALEVGSDSDPDTLWEEIEDSAREDWNTFSFFIVSETVAKAASPLFVSSDWPTAEAFAKQRLVQTQ